jgi:hypothetical protein
MFFTATAGLGVNLAMMKILHQGHGHSHGGGHSHGSHGHGGHGHGGAAKKPSAAEEEENLNVRAAFIHVVGDLVQSIGVMIAAAIIWAFPGAHIADPVCTFVFSILVLFTTFGVLKSASSTLLNGVPPSVSLNALALDILAIPGVANLHDLHVWSYAANRNALSAHLVADDPPAALASAQAVARKHGIRHSTFQVERCGTEEIVACASANDHADNCALDFPAGLAAGGGGEASPWGGSRTPAFTIDRPSVGALHGGHPMSPASAQPPKFAVGHGHDDEHEGHGHSHGGGGHGHAHGGGATPASAAPTPTGHGHSHGGKACHGHGHGTPKVAISVEAAAEEGHGHSHGSGASTPASSGGHGHSHEGGHGHAH